MATGFMIISTIASIIINILKIKNSGCEIIIHNLSD